MPPGFELLLIGYAAALAGMQLKARSRDGARANWRWPARVLVAVWVLHTVFVGLRWWQQGHPPFASLFDTVVFLAWAMVLSLWLVRRHPALDRVQRGVLLLVLGILGVAFFMDASVRPLMPALQSHWISIHVMSCFIGYGAFGVAFVAGLLYLVLRRRGRDEPSLRGLETLIGRATEVGFPFLTVGIIVGSIWANEAWGTYWSWDPKETWSLITWVVYAILLHGRRTLKWNGSRLAALSIVGFAVVVFSFVGVNFLLAGLHSYL